MPAEAPPPGDRLFIALQPPPTAIAALDERREALRIRLQAHDPGLRLRWVRSRGIHLTLRFLGETAAARLPAISEAIAETAARTPPLQLRVGGLGVFGGARARVVWVGLEGDTGALTRCAMELNEALAAAGLPSQESDFRPHLTLARVPQRAAGDARRAVRAAVAEVPVSVPVDFRADAIHLIRSDLGPGGARYTTIASSPLIGRADRATP